MKKTTPSALWLAAAALAAVLLCTSSAVDALSSTTQLLGYSGTSSAVDALSSTTQLLGYSGTSDDDDEFLMESGSSGQSLRMLQAGSKNSYGAVNRGRAPFECGRAQHYCIGNGKYRKFYCSPSSREKACHH